MKDCDEAFFSESIKELEAQGRVNLMKDYLQHGSVSTFEHCISVARLSYGIYKFLNAGKYDKELIRGAMLHDYYLYDWHHHDGPLHGPYHPKAALKNAEEDFSDLTEREKNIISSHMWPLGITRVPRCREAVIVCISDKIVSTHETLFRRAKNKIKKIKGIE